MLLFTFLCFLVYASPAQGGQDRETLLLIHLDGISYDLFQSEFEAGRLPNLESAFADHGGIIPGLTYFPPKTPVVITRIKEGLDSSTGRIVSWEGYNRKEHVRMSRRNIQLETSYSMSRRGRTNALYGTKVMSNLGLDALDRLAVPLLARLAGPALINTADLVERYGVVDFYWLSTDTYGHTVGRIGQLHELYTFDHYFGRLDARIDETVNIIIYSDHGMTFGEHKDPERKVTTLAGDDLIMYSYPNLYLDKDADLSGIARQLALEDPVAFAFYRDGGTVTGYHGHDTVLFKSSAEGIRYFYEGSDPFGYYRVGYEGQPLSAEKWLEFTHALEYPASPPSVYRYLNNPHAGDLVVVSSTDYNPEQTGEHRTLHRLDMKVPVFVRGPDLEHLYNRKPIWLDRLQEEVQALEHDHFFSWPSREPHSLMLSGRLTHADLNPGLQISISPRYRLQLEAALREDKSPHLWAEYDVFSTYLSRFWVGAGAMQYNNNPNLGLRLRYELSMDRFGAQYMGKIYRHSTTSSFSVSYSLLPDLEVVLTDFEGIGIKIRW